MISLSDGQLRMLVSAARSVPVEQRDAFLQAVAQQLQNRRPRDDRDLDLAARQALRAVLEAA
jgi:hypothetical protein